jgi:hypothetical protein
MSILGYISDNAFSSGTRQFSVGDGHKKFVCKEERIGTRGTEELEVGL